MSRAFLAILAFIAVASMIWFCACAGGVKWGSEAAFMMAMIGCAVSSAAALFILSESWK